MLFPPACESALAAMDLVRALLRPSCKALDAWVATLGDVCFLFAMMQFLSVDLAVRL